MDVLLRLQAHMNRYSENIAELLLLGRSELGDFYSASIGLRQGLDELERLQREELDFLGNGAERDAEEIETVRTRRMRELFAEIDRKARQLLALHEDGRHAEAVEMFEAEIENGLDAELEEQMHLAITDEVDELREVDRRTNALEDSLQLLVAGVGLLGLVVAFCVWAVLARSLTQPIRALIEGSRAIAKGDLAQRIAYDRKDEFADLAEQFNATAATLEAERAALLTEKAELESIVARRTSELSEANERLRRIDQMRTVFLAEIGHELRTPLTIMRGEAEVALRGERTEAEHRDTHGRIVDLAQQMGRLVEDLLFLARAEVGAVRFELQPLAADEVVDAALQSARVLAVDTNVTLTPVAPCRRLVEGDAERLNQALLIVLDNAIKYSAPGSEVDVKLRVAGDALFVRIASRGDTIPADDLPYVFNHFYRGRKAGAGGVGLGLPIAKWIIDRHRGTISITSAQGRTVVEIVLPLLASPPLVA